jgi:hypothetical protein
VASADATAKKVRISMSMRRRSLPRSEAPPPVPIPHQANSLDPLLGFADPEAVNARILLEFAIF